MDVKELFHNLINIKADNVEIIKEGISNINYKIFADKDIFIMRIPRNNIVGINFFNQEKILNKVKDINVDVIYYNKDNGILISKYVNYDKNKKVSFKEASDILKKLHSLDSKNIDDFDPFKLIDTYKSIINKNIFFNENVVIEKVKVLYKKYDKVVCHNDLLYANFLINDSKTFLIDYEYSGKNISLFDIASFLSENDIDETKYILFLNEYFEIVNDDLLNDLKIMFLFLDILWGYWAYTMYHLYNEDIFKEIYKHKLNRYTKSYNF